MESETQPASDAAPSAAAPPAENDEVRFRERYDLDPPVLHWKLKALAERTLRANTANLRFDTLTHALDWVNRRRGKNIFLVSRAPSEWVAFEYVIKTICRVHYRELRIGGLPLGGNPLAPQTYIIDSRKRITHIVHDEHGYQLRKMARPDEEPTVSAPWVNALVPVEEVNHGKNLTWLPRVTFSPTLDELPTVLAWVDQNMPGAKVKAGGARHAWSRAAVSTDVYVVPDSLKRFAFIAGEPGEPDIYRHDLGDRRSNLVRCGSGHHLREVNQFLWIHNKSIPALGGWDMQTIGGVFPTGTHSSVFTRGPLADMIVSIDLVCANGSLVRIEPGSGITDRARLAAERPEIRLIQEDDYYYAALINIGTMGVVQSYVLEVTDAFHLKEIRTVIKMPELKEKLRNGKICELSGARGKPADLAREPPRISNGKDGGFATHPFSAYYLEFVLNPYSDLVAITSRHPVLVDNDNIFTFEPPGRDLVRTIELGARFTRPAIPVWIQENFRDLLVWIVNTIVKIIPQATPSLLDSALNTLVDDAYIDRSFNVFNLGHGTSEIPAFAGSIYIPLENDDYLQALDIIRDVAARFAKRRIYETAPFSMRFMRGIPAMLGCPKDYCSFEFIFTGANTHAQEMIDAYEEALRQKFGNEVRTHWGQLMRDPSADQMRGMYAQYDRWRTIHDELDPDGRFLNEWQTQILPPVAS
jgi:FAD/FMN-containing dehydrogenase